MPSKVYSAAVVGVDAFEVETEVHASWGNDFRIAVVGLPDTAVKESKDRVLSAIHNSGLRGPEGRITINLAPADLRKEGPSFDLPIALGLLMIVVFSLGLACTLTGLGIAVVSAGKLTARLNVSSRLTLALPALSALVILVAGAVLTAKAVPQLS